MNLTLNQKRQSEKDKYRTIQLIRSIQTSYICRNIKQNETCQRLEKCKSELLNDHKLLVLPGGKDLEIGAQCEYTYPTIIYTQEQLRSKFYVMCILPQYSIQSHYSNSSRLYLIFTVLFLVAIPSIMSAMLLLFCDDTNSFFHRK